jgi:hypothetical protein
MLGAESSQELRIWKLLTGDFYWCVPADFPVQVFGRLKANESKPARLQIFEIAVAAIFSQLRPEYRWHVTENRPDRGLDFIGEIRFLDDSQLGIAAAITIGGQCKKRSGTKKNIADELLPSLDRMRKNINPTFFVVALSARVAEGKLQEAREALEESQRRHCHILDRDQIEGLFSDHLGILSRILHEALSVADAREIIEYFEANAGKRGVGSLEFQAPARVLAGVPFRIAVTVRSPLLATGDIRLWWRARSETASHESHGSITLIAPINADSVLGAPCEANSTPGDPLGAQISIELISYCVGKVGLGEVTVGRDGNSSGGHVRTVDLGTIQVIENVRPRFFERPFRFALTTLSDEYERAVSRGVASVAVTGAGGSGKSRLCEEFSLEKRRRGSQLVQAKQTKTLNDPHRILADLLIGLAGPGPGFGSPADAVVHAVSQYDANLADRAAPAIRSIAGMSNEHSGKTADQEILSAILLLIHAKIRCAPLIIHLQDLHWSTADTLSLLGRLVWQLEMLYKSDTGPPIPPGRGVFFIFEGRNWESQVIDSELWSTRTFEIFLEKLGCSIICCPAFDALESLEFVRRLFENRHSASRLIDPALLELQAALAEEINRTAGGNPFHTLEQIKLLKQRRVLDQNPETGLLYMVQPTADQSALPDEVFKLIQLRWQYLKSRKPELAMLLWASALLEDRIPGPLFRHLWRSLRPSLSLAEIDATGFLWTGTNDQSEVSFRHENYFQSLRRLEIEPTQQKNVIEIYNQWFAQARQLDAANQFRWARILMKSRSPDAQRIRSLLRSALAGAQRRSDLSLARRVLTTLLDFSWNFQPAMEMRLFLKYCRDEISLCRSLLSSERVEAGQRITLLRSRIRERLPEQALKARTIEALQFLTLTADILHADILFNDRQPARAAEIAEQAIADIRAMSAGLSAAQRSTWRKLEMDALHSFAVALALGGEIDAAVSASEQAVNISRESPDLFSFSLMSTYANILLARDLEASEALLRQCFVRASSGTDFDALDTVAINLGMTLLLQGYRLQGSEASQADTKLTEASRLLISVFTRSFRVGRYPDAAASALLLGIVAALRNEDDEISWFAQAITAAARGGQMETLWRSHLNLATSLHRRKGKFIETIRDHARATLHILQDTLSPYAEPDRSARFQWVRIPLAQAVRFLIESGDDAGPAALERYPALRRCFQDPERGVLQSDRGGFRSHEWVTIGQWDYVIF